VLQLGCWMRVRCTTSPDSCALLGNQPSDPSRRKDAAARAFDIAGFYRVLGRQGVAQEAARHAAQHLPYNVLTCGGWVAKKFHATIGGFALGVRVVIEPGGSQSAVGQGDTRSGVESHCSAANQMEAAPREPLMRLRLLGKANEVNGFHSPPPSWQIFVQSFLRPPDPGQCLVILVNQITEITGGGLARPGQTDYTCALIRSPQGFHEPTERCRNEGR
jgi:hypothetical protein